MYKKSYDTNGAPISLISQVSLGSKIITGITSSTAFTLPANTTLVRIRSKDGEIYGKWGASTASIADNGFDFDITEGGPFDFVVPPGVTTINLISASGVTGTIIYI